MQNRNQEQMIGGHICPACLCTGGKKFGSHQNVTIVECLECRSIFFPRPISNVNKYNEYYPYLKEFDERRAKKELALRLRQSKKKIENIKKCFGVAKEIKLLDVGAGPGYFVAHARDAGINAVAAEVDPAAINFGKAHFDINYTDIYNCGDREFDAITFFHVLEHMEDPNRFFEQCLRLLKPGGVVFIHLPRATSLSEAVQSLLKSLILAKSERRGCLYLPDHLTGFTILGVKRFVIRGGLREVRCRKVSAFNAEYDPWFIEFRLRTFRGIYELFYKLANDLIDLGSGGAWISFLARKPLEAERVNPKAI